MRKEYAGYIELKKLNKIRLNIESKLYKCNLDAEYVDLVTSDFYKHIVQRLGYLLSKIAPSHQWSPADAEEFVDVLSYSKSYKQFCLEVYKY